MIHIFRVEGRPEATASGSATATAAATTTTTAEATAAARRTAERAVALRARRVGPIGLRAGAVFQTKGLMRFAVPGSGQGNARVRRGNVMPI